MIDTCWDTDAFQGVSTASLLCFSFPCLIDFSSGAVRETEIWSSTSSMRLFGRRIGGKDEESRALASLSPKGDRS